MLNKQQATPNQPVVCFLLEKEDIVKINYFFIAFSVRLLMQDIFMS